MIITFQVFFTDESGTTKYQCNSYQFMTDHVLLFITENESTESVYIIPIKNILSIRIVKQGGL
jgi:hypothetical protein